jgi:hypothetical protein
MYSSSDIQAPNTQLEPGEGPPRDPPTTARGLQDQPDDKPDSDVVVSLILTHAQIIWSELLVLNGSCSAIKRNELELMLDRAVLALSTLAERVSKKKVAVVMRMLRWIRDYRRLFPRPMAAEREREMKVLRILQDLP